MFPVRTKGIDEQRNWKKNEPYFQDREWRGIMGNNNANGRRKGVWWNDDYLKKWTKRKCN